MSLALQDFCDFPYPHLYELRKRIQLKSVDTEFATDPGPCNLALKPPYLSPPMSNPSSPPISAESMAEIEIVRPALFPRTTSLHEPTTALPTIPALTSSFSNQPGQPREQSWYYQADSATEQPLGSPALEVSASATDVATSGAPPPVSRSTEFQGAQTNLAPNPPEEFSVGRRQNIPRGRPRPRTKAHVASACVNCKRAHLSCDIQRPCTRCVATGKQDSCVDVQHKKRGRPRIREEAGSERSGRQIESPQVSPSISEPALVISSSAGQRQGGPDRNLRSYKQEAPPAVCSAPIQGLPALMAASPSLLPTVSPSLLMSSSFAPSDFPMVLLDLDLVVVKTNSRFRELVTGGNEIRGYSLEHCLGPNGIDTVRRLRNELREERETREPSYLPPIITPGEQAAVEAVSEESLDLLTSDYVDRPELLVFRLPSGQLQPIPVRIKLGRTSMFFVALTISPSNGRTRIATSHQFHDIHASIPTAAWTSTYPTSQHSTYIPTTRPSPLHSFQSLSTSLPHVPVTAPTYALSPTPQYDYPRSHSSTPLPATSAPIPLFPRPRSAYEAPPMRQDITSQTPSLLTLQQPHLPPIAGMIPSSRESSEQGSLHQERSQRSEPRSQEPEPEREQKRRRLDISDVLE